MSINEEWKEVRLGDICFKIGSGATPKGGKEAYYENGIPLIRSQNILDFTFSHDGLVFINDMQAKKLKNVIVEENDILLNITGDSVARVCQPPKEVIPARVNQHVAIIRPDDKIIDNKFLKYYLLNKKIKNYMLNLSSAGATRKALTKVMIENLRIKSPPLPTQKKIAEILSSLDDKIELNNQMNKNLEEMAQALFKQWFVDFEFPNEDGEPYKSSGGEMVESELGLIPKGWEVKELGDFIKVKHGFAFKSKDFSDIETRLKVLTPGNFKVGGGFKADKFKYLKSKTEFPNNYIFNEDDLMVTMTDLSKLGDTLGYPAFIPKSKKNLYLHNQRLGKVELKTDLIGINFFYFLMCSREYRGSILGSVTCLTVKHTAPKRIEAHKFAFNSTQQEIYIKFENLVSSIRENIKEKEFEIQKLTKLRDTLLPKLMNGEIDVNEVEV